MSDVKKVIDEQALMLIEEQVRRFLEYMGLDDSAVKCETKVIENSSESAGPKFWSSLHINIADKSTGPLLIGPRGGNLAALQHLLRVVLQRQLTMPMRIIVDVNGYLIHRDRGLKMIAETAAKRASETGQAVMLRPMQAAERRTIHTALSTRTDVATESMGDEPNRRVLVRPVSL